MLALVFGEKELFWDGKLKASDVRVAVKVRTSHIPGPLYRIKNKSLELRPIAGRGDRCFLAAAALSGIKKTGFDRTSSP
jgi:hypothetical protein